MEKKILGLLNKFVSEEKQNEINGYSKEYKESKWYRDPTNRDIFGQQIATDVNSFKKALEAGNADLEEFATSFEQSAHEYGASWWDDDLEQERSGYEYECEVYVKLYNMIAEVTGKAPLRFDECYEGRGRA